MTKPYAAVPARRSRWSRGGASRPSSAPAAGSARHRAGVSRRNRASRSPTQNLHRAGDRFGVAFVLGRLRTLDTAGVPGRTNSLFRAALVAMSLQELAHQLLVRRCAVPVRDRSRSSSGLRWTRGRLWHPRRQHRPLRTVLGSRDRCKGRRFAARRMSSPLAADQVVLPPRREEMRGGHCVQSSATINPGIASPPNLAAW